MVFDAFRKSALPGAAAGCNFNMARERANQDNLYKQVAQKSKQVLPAFGK